MLVLLAVAVVVPAVKYGRRLVRLDNFGVVEEGRIYRSGQPMPWQIEDVARTRGLRTVISAREPETPPWMVRWEEEACARADVRLVRFEMPGDGRGTFEQYDEALAILREPTNLPALVHCARGSYRTGAIIASYRVLDQGWSEDDAFREMDEFRADKKDRVLVPHLKEYFRSRWDRKPEAQNPKP